MKLMEKHYAFFFLISMSKSILKDERADNFPYEINNGFTRMQKLLKWRNNNKMEGGLTF